VYVPARGGMSVRPPQHGARGISHGTVLPRRKTGNLTKYPVPFFPILRKNFHESKNFSCHFRSFLGFL
jgi:hypothetical protein